jgi:hypothetical protein
MSTEQMTFDNAAWGSPPPEPRRWGGRETAAAIGIAAVIAGFGGAAIYAATGNSLHHVTGPTAAHQVFGPPSGLGGGPMGAAGPAGPGEKPLHGQFVVSDADGYTTVLTQVGTVTAVSPMSVTVRSDDGFSQIWTTSAIRTTTYVVGDDVMIRGVQKDDRSVVTEVLDPHLPAG